VPNCENEIIAHGETGIKKPEALEREMYRMGERQGLMSKDGTGALSLKGKKKRKGKWLSGEMLRTSL